MTSLFPQFGNVFGANAPAGRNELVSFNAGKMTVAPTANGKFLITPDLKKGKISLSRGDDQLLHFQWTDRQSGSNPEDFIIFPDDASFSKVDTGRAGDRVLLLQYKNSSRRFFFWMQNKDASRDDELIKKVNDCMNNAQQSIGGGDSSGRGGAGAGNVQLDHNAIMQMLGAMGAGEQGRGGAGGQNSVQMAELQNILQNMGLPASQSAVSSPAMSAVSSSQASQSGGGSSIAATTASTTHDHDMGGDDHGDDDDDDDEEDDDEDDEMTEEEMLRLAIEESMRDTNADTATASMAVSPPAPVLVPAPTPAPLAMPAPAAPVAGITAADLARAMASIQSLTGMQQPKPVKLTTLLSAENISSLLSDENAVEALLPHLPEGAQNAYELQATLHSPQLRQGIASLVSALQTGNYNAVVTNFGLDPAAGAAKLAYGDVVGAFLDAIQHWADQQNASMDSGDATTRLPPST